MSDADYHLRTIQESKERAGIFLPNTKIQFQTENQRRYAEAVRKHPLVFCSGPAGTGKTVLAVALGLEAIRNGSVTKMIITRPVVECGENLGFLPGTVAEKTAPYMRPIKDAIEFLTEGSKEKFKPEVIPLAYMKGLNLDSTFVIVDEAQNATRTQLAVVMTRLIGGSKCVIVGDPEQSDIGDNSYFARIQKYFEQGTRIDVPLITHVRLDQKDVQRDAVVKQALLLLQEIK